ncbi:hypothetical protein L596_009441 [Steinernema carpocapsae]|uniref:Uncharacterized protein n=1 Tax=Steinernema carpocapsae TaxID=34508 RepID=A0A4U5PGN7_STECR|nr:hypothetical protein L596_009441 [Steinernema carpocapsae]
MRTDSYLIRRLHTSFVEEKQRLDPKAPSDDGHGGFRRRAFDFSAASWREFEQCEQCDRDVEWEKESGQDEAERQCERSRS